MSHDASLVKMYLVQTEVARPRCSARQLGHLHTEERSFKTNSVGEISRRIVERQERHTNHSHTSFTQSWSKEREREREKRETCFVGVSPFCSTARTIAMFVMRMQLCERKR
jgi:hypothetical protein